MLITVSRPSSTAHVVAVPSANSAVGYCLLPTEAPRWGPGSLRLGPHLQPRSTELMTYAPSDTTSNMLPSTACSSTWSACHGAVGSIRDRSKSRRNHWCVSSGLVHHQGQAPRTSDPSTAAQTCRFSRFSRRTWHIRCLVGRRRKVRLSICRAWHWTHETCYARADTHQLEGDDHGEQMTYVSVCSQMCSTAEPASCAGARARASRCRKTWASDGVQGMCADTFSPCYAGQLDVRILRLRRAWVCHGPYGEALSPAGISAQQRDVSRPPIGVKAHPIRRERCAGDPCLSVTATSLAAQALRDDWRTCCNPAGANSGYCLAGWTGPGGGGTWAVRGECSDVCVRTCIEGQHQRSSRTVPPGAKPRQARVAARSTLSRQQNASAA